jgi:hypothetical protein
MKERKSGKASGKKPKTKMSQLRSLESIAVEKVFSEPDSPEPKVKVFMPMYLPLRVETCKKCKMVMAEPKELIRITSMKP